MKMDKAKMKNGLIAYLRVPFTMIVWVMETYEKNRARVKVFMMGPRVASAFKIGLLLTAIIWVVIGVTATDEDGQRLTDTLKTFWSENIQSNDD